MSFRFTMTATFRFGVRSSHRRASRSMSFRRNVTRLPRPAQMLAKAILNHPVDKIFSATEHAESFQNYHKNVFTEIGEVAPQLLPTSFSSMATYQRNLARLVVEESIETVLSSLKVSLEGLKKRNRTQGVYVRTIEKDSYGFFKSWTTAPLKPYFRKELKAGTVILLLPKGKNLDPKSFSLGIIQTGSTKSAKCECSAVLLSSSMPSITVPYLNESAAFHVGRATLEKGRPTEIFPLS